MGVNLSVPLLLLFHSHHGWLVDARLPPPMCVDMFVVTLRLLRQRAFFMDAVYNGLGVLLNLLNGVHSLYLSFSPRVCF